MENNQFITDLEITAYLNSSLAILDTDLINKFNDYKITAYTTTITSSTNTITMPLDFVKFRGLDVWYNLGSQDGYRIIPEHSFQHRNRLAVGSNVSFFGPSNLTYRLQGQQLVILPASFASQWTYRVWYTPQYIPLVNTSDPLQTYMDGQYWSEYSVVDTCVKIMAKQDQDPSTFMAQAAELKEYIIKLATPNRNLGEPKSVQEGSRDCGFWFDPGYS